MEQLREILRQTWGYDDFRPLQAEAMSAVVEGRDSVVVLPTGGGKSLCFQAPAVAMPGLAVVVSPLISLMKDQVDSLSDNGVPAACVNSTLSFDERRRVADEIRSGRLKLLYLSPERLMTDQTLSFLQNIPLSFIAIDEAHCISDWGHDFRPEYRMLRQLKETFPGIALHAYTATATEHVRDDIVRELQLVNPEVLVGSFDRPNLVYRVQRRGDRMKQICEVIERHKDESGIVYCIRRTDVEEICAALKDSGYSARPYHAGMSDNDRRNNQDAFINDRARIIVATVAFGMGIDKSDVRYVIHAAAPKSLEAYQQESGRAGRDGLEAECCLFYTAGDFQLWRKMQQELPPEALATAMNVLAGIEKFVATVGCRHRAIVGYFGQELETATCKACDVCLDELDFVPDALVVAQKIVSCVLRLKERFGLAYTAMVLTGSREQRIRENAHDKLSTWGLLKEYDKRVIGDWIDQLVDQGFLLRTEDEYPLLQVTTEGRTLLRGDVTPRLLKPTDRKRREARQQKAALDSWEGVDRGLFDDLRTLRREKADERGLAPFIVFGDATLRDMARRRPSTSDGLLAVHGVGQRKAEEYGYDFLQRIVQYCEQHGLEMDAAAAATPARRERAAAPAQRGSRSATAASPTGLKQTAFAQFARGESLDAVAAEIGRARSTIRDYLCEYITTSGTVDASPWIDEGNFEQIRVVAASLGLDKAKPIYEALDGHVGYDDIWIALACLRNAAATA